MAKVFTNKTSYSLLKTNPKLTGNIKMVVDSKGDIFIETIDASPELTRNKYKKVKLDLENSWSSSIYNFFNKGSIPKTLLYALKDVEDFYSIKTDFSKQYYTDYQQGIKPKISKLYDEQISYFAPIWLEPNDIPEHFAIFKIPEPVSVSTKNEENSFNADIEKQIYDANYFDTFSGATASDYFFNTVLSKAKLHKVFDLGADSTLGKYLRNHINDVEMPESSLTIDWNINSNSTVNGISLEKSGFTKEAMDMFSEAFPVDRTVTEFDNYITNQFQNKGVVHPNIINLEFLFDDEEDADFTVNRYFGIYFNKNDISKFNLDSKAFYDKKYDNIKQNKDIESVSSVDVLSDSNIVLENKDGIKLFVDYGTEYNVPSSDIKGSNFLPYVYSTDRKFYDLENNLDWQSNELILKDTIINTRDFKGFTKDSVGIIPSTKTNKSGRSYFEFKITGTTNSFELRIKDVDEYKTDFNLNQVFVGNTGLTRGTFDGNQFSLQGTPDEVANAIVSAINSYSQIDEDFNINAIAKFDKVVVFTRGINEYWNKYKYLIYSDDINFPNTIDVPYKTFDNLVDFNTKRGTGFSFLDYNSVVAGATSMFISSDFSILESNLTNGNNESKNKIRIPIEFTSYFNTSLFLKTQTWYSKIVSIDAYLDEPVYENGRIVDFTNFDSYKTINCTGDVWVSPGAYSELYEIETNKVGLMSMYPIKQFDYDQFRSEYGKDGDGYIEKLDKQYWQKGGTSTNTSGNPIYPDANNIQFSIKNFRDTGFKRLTGKIDEVTGDIPTITNEYDRLSENGLPELSIKGRIIPYINKWVYDDDGKDVRENNYRMTSNSAFSYDNFSPSSKNVLPDFRFFTHEWYYLQKYPYYLTTKEKIESFSYFENAIEKGSYAIGATNNLGVKDITEDKFLEYFTEYKVGNYYFPAKRKYSIISGGNEDSFGETFFRGTKIKFKRRVESDTPLNSNIENIGVFKSDEFNGYKFSAILTNNTDNALNYSIIENKKYKTITMIIEAQLQDYYLNYDNSGATGATALHLDRSSLYVLEDKFDSTGNYDDVELSGSISPFIEDGSINIANFTNDGTFYTINGTQNTANNSIPNFINQIVPTTNGKYEKILIVVPGGTLEIDEIGSVTKNTIKAKEFNFITGTGSTPIPNIHDSTLPFPNQCLDKIPIYQKGGYNAYKGLINDISFATIFDKVNSGSPDINYITVDEVGGTAIGATNTFLIEFEDYSTNVKADYITTEPIIFNGLANTNFEPIGSKTIGLNSTYFSTMFRFNGNYNPKVNDVIYFSEDFDTKFTDAIRKQLRFTNTNFFSTYPGFGLYKQLYINKINEQNPLTILDLNKESALRPEFWKVGEISIDKQDSYIFRSCWDHNFHKRYESKTDFTSFPGYIEPKEVGSFLASTIMNIPDDVKIEKYGSSNIVIDTNSNNVISGQIKNTQELIDKINPSLKPLFDKYVNSSYNFQKLDTLDDDIERYIKTNILPRYFSREIYAYVKYSSKLSNEPVLETSKTEQELILDGFIRLENISFVQQKFNDFDFNFTYNKPSDKNVTLAFITKVTTV
tara:strand:+ start:1812 stop:6479 length:4668 start_codon:yes stop_codon:yes gene_type:complete